MASVGLGAMFYISPQLTVLMLAVVPPVSLGVVSRATFVLISLDATIFSLGDLWSVSQTALEQNPGGTRRDDQGKCNNSATLVFVFIFPLKLQVAQESLSALRTVQAYNALKPEQDKFDGKVNQVLSLARKEAIASGIFFGSTGWSGNVTLLCLLGYGEQ